MKAAKNIELVKFKLNKIYTVWDRFILNYKLCQNEINFTEDVKSNFVSDVLSHFNDTLILIEKNYKIKDWKKNHASTIVFLQSLYVQQDFIEELLTIFKCKINKGDLKLDSNYQLNREIRNELVGHPLRFARSGKKSLISTSLFHFNLSGIDKISYLRYHKDKVFKQELISYSREEILNRHLLFLNYYLDKIILKINTILHIFLKYLNQLEIKIAKIPFVKLVNYTYITYEYFYKSFDFNKEDLVEVYNRKHVHLRYKNYIEKFYASLEVIKEEEKKEIQKLLIPIDEKKSFKKRQLKIELVFEDGPNIIEKDKFSTLSICYELSKLSSPGDAFDFDFFAGILSNKCKENELVNSELVHMRNNLNNKLEYNCSYYLIRNSLDNEFYI